MRPRDALTPEQERDLEALDRALSGEPVEFELRELEELVLDIRATAPEMTPAFAARLEHDVSEGFPTPREQPALVHRPGRRWLLLPAVGSVATVLVALVVVLGSGSTSDELSSGAGTTANEVGAVQSEQAPRDAGALADEPGVDADADADESTSSLERRKSTGGSAAQALEPAPAPPADRAAPAPATSAAPAPAPSASVGGAPGGRKVERNAAIAIETRADEFDTTTDAVNAVMARFGGIVASAQIGQSDASGGEATFDLRIPTSRLDRALTALSALGHVTERSQGLQDITGSFTSAQSRLTDARAERRGLLRALERATTQAQVDSLKAQLRSVGGRISAHTRRLASLKRRADLATVSLTVRGTGKSTQTGGGSWTPGDAAGDAVRVLEVLAGVLLVGLAVLVPAALLGAAIAFGVRLGRRRRRETALDPA